MDAWITAYAIVVVLVAIWWRRRHQPRRRAVPVPAKVDYKHPHYRRLRKEVFRLAGYQCTAAGCRERATACHHWVYRGPGRERLGDLQAFCDFHHSMADVQRRAWERMTTR